MLESFLRRFDLNICTSAEFTVTMFTAASASTPVNHLSIFQYIFSLHVIAGDPFTLVVGIICKGALHASHQRFSPIFDLQYLHEFIIEEKTMERLDIILGYSFFIQWRRNEHDDFDWISMSLKCATEGTLNESFGRNLTFIKKYYIPISKKRLADRSAASRLRGLTTRV